MKKIISTTDLEMSTKAEDKESLLTVDEIISRLIVISQSGRGEQILHINNSKDKFNPELIGIKSIFVNCNDVVMINVDI